jgi:fructose-1,6-bisphosphatase
MMEMERLNPELSEVESIFTSIQVGCKAISNLVRKSALQSNTGYAFGGGSINVQGEVQTKMDLLANDVLKNALQWAGHFKTIAS